MDDAVIHELSKLCQFWHKTEAGVCTDLSFFDPTTIFEGTIRHHSDKTRILGLVSKLTSLKALNLRKCKIGTCPQFEMPFLENLDLSCNDLTDVPSWVGSLCNLKHLNLGANQLEAVPPLPNLESLKIHKNRIAKLPPLPKTLRTLNLYLNHLTEIPPLDFPNLEFLSFGVSKIKSVPVLPQGLRWLSLVVNEIEYLPENFCDTELEGVRLAKNHLKELPSDIGRMKLKELTLYRNELKSLPKSIYNLRLRKLNISGNPLTDSDLSQAREAFGKIDFFESERYA